MSLGNALVNLDTYSLWKAVLHPRYTFKLDSSCWENKLYHESSYHAKRRLDL